jgi:hypothetical protein
MFNVTIHEAGSHTSSRVTAFPTRDDATQGMVNALVADMRANRCDPFLWNQYHEAIALVREGNSVVTVTHPSASIVYSLAE